MSWLSNFIRPKVKRIAQSKDVKKNNESHDWAKCTKCSHMINSSELEKNLYVCPSCEKHMRMPVDQRLDSIYGKDNYVKIKTKAAISDPLSFRDTKKYTERLKIARAKTKQIDAMTIAKGKLADYPLVTAVFNFDFMGGSMGAAVGEAFVEAANIAMQEKGALLLISASGGARMQEGAISLMQLPRTVLTINRLNDAKLPYIVLLCDPTTGGVTASIAMLGDIHLAEPEALIGFAGQRVIRATARVELPKNFQLTEFLVEHGFVDQVVHRKDLRLRLSSILNILMSKKVATKPLSNTINEDQLNAIPTKNYAAIKSDAKNIIPDAVKPEAAAKK